MSSTERRDAEEALAVIRQEQAAVADRLNEAETGGSRWVVPVVMGAAVAALLVDSAVVLVVATVVYLAGTLMALGTPVRAGVVPRENRRSLVQVCIGTAALFAVFTAGMAGQQFELWWLTGLAAVSAVAVTIGVMRWRRAGAGARVTRA
ncbi:hypothetical protein [Micromonospora sp. NPDC004704]